MSTPTKEKKLDNGITEITYEFRGRPVPKKWTKSIYDGSSGEVFGRTPKSWGKQRLILKVAANSGSVQIDREESSDDGGH